MTSTRTNPKSRCPACLKTLDGAFDPWRYAAPEAGDLSVCAYCTAPLVFNDDLTLCALHADAYAALPPELRRQLDLARRLATRRLQNPDPTPLPNDLVRTINNVLYGHLPRRTCTADAPMRPEDRTRFRWSHHDAVQDGEFLNLMRATCPHCKLSFTCPKP